MLRAKILVGLAVGYLLLYVSFFVALIALGTARLCRARSDTAGYRHSAEGRALLP